MKGVRALMLAKGLIQAGFKVVLVPDVNGLPFLYIRKTNKRIVNVEIIEEG